MATFTDEQQFFITRIRSMLSMRYAPAAGSSFQLPSKLGDEEIWEDLLSGLNMFNIWPPNITSVTLRDIYNAYDQNKQNGGDPLAPTVDVGWSAVFGAIELCAVFYVGIRLQWFEAAKHFRYNDNGISIERVKQQDYANIVNGSVLQFLTGQMTNLKISLGLSMTQMKGQFSGMISFPRSLTRGLRGTRLGS